MTILIGLLVIMLGGLCYYRTRRQHEQRQEEISSHVQDPVFHYLNENSSDPNTTVPSRSNFYAGALQRWKVFRHGSITDRNTQTMASQSAQPLQQEASTTVPSSVVVPTDPPPAYEGRLLSVLIFLSIQLAFDFIL